MQRIFGISIYHLSIIDIYLLISYFKGILSMMGISVQDEQTNLFELFDYLIDKCNKEYTQCKAELKATKDSISCNSNYK